MGDDQRRAVFAQLIHGNLYGPFAFGIKRTCCLIQQQHRRVPQDRAGNGDALLLPARQHHPAFAQIAVIAIWQSIDEVMGRRGFCSGPHLSIGGVGAAKANILSSTCGEYDRVLRHQGNGLAKDSAVHVTQIQSIKRNPS